MKDIRVNFIKKISRTSTVVSFRFKPQEDIGFTAGQFLKVVFDENNLANKDLNKYLSFSCGTDKDYIEVTKRLSDSDFSDCLRNLKPNQEILLKGPMGNCVLNEKHKNICYLVGGIGITPVISMLEEIESNDLDYNIILIYSNRTEEEITFRTKLDNLEKKINLKNIYLVSHCEPEDNECIYGIINEDILKDNINDLDNKLFYIFGPPGMVNGVKETVLNIGVDKTNIKFESFMGYE